MKQILKKILAFFGIAIVKIKYLKPQTVVENYSIDSKSALIHNGFNLLKQKGFNPNHIIDVGANHGTWTRDTLIVFPDANYTLIEPQNWLSSSFSDLLESEKFMFLPIGVGKEKGNFLFTIVERDDSCSFRVSENEAKQKGYEQIKIEVDTINNVVKNSKFGMPDMLKIDAEGLDLQVLEGASDILGYTEVILLEASVLNPDFSNDVLSVLDFMDKNSYKIFDITDLNRPFKNQVLWLVELLFIKKNGKFDKINWLE